MTLHRCCSFYPRAPVGRDTMCSPKLAGLRRFYPCSPYGLRLSDVVLAKRSFLHVVIGWFLLPTNVSISVRYQRDKFTNLLHDVFILEVRAQRALKDACRRLWSPPSQLSRAGSLALPTPGRLVHHHCSRVLSALKAEKPCKMALGLADAVSPRPPVKG